jgi:hypothetical protein
MNVSTSTLLGSAPPIDGALLGEIKWPIAVPDYHDAQRFPTSPHLSLALKVSDLGDRAVQLLLTSAWL